MASRESLRMRVVSRARLFKRSWVDMAEALVQVRNDRLYEEWGYSTLHEYALEELHIKPSTTDKLTGSYHALERHVPHVLTWDGVAQQIPAVEAVDYFAKAMEPTDESRSAPTPEQVDELKQAIFEEQVSAPAARRRFEPLLAPKSEQQRQGEHRRRALGAVRKLLSTLPEIDGLDTKRLAVAEGALTALEEDLLALDEG